MAGTTEKGLSSKLDKLTELLEEKEDKKEKKFKLGFSKRIGEKQKIKSNHVLVVLIRTNGKVIIKYLPVKDNMIYLRENDTYHFTPSNYIGYYKQYPVVVLPEWLLEPISRKEMTEEGNDALPQKVVINAMKLAQIKPKSALAGKAMIWLVIGGIIALYLMYNMVTGGTIT